MAGTGDTQQDNFKVLGEQLNVVIQSLDSLQERMESVGDKLERRMDRIEDMQKRMVPVFDSVFGLISDKYNLYSALAKRSVSSRGSDFRASLMESTYGTTSRTRKTSHCMVTDICQNGEKVVASHIVPAKSNISHLFYIGFRIGEVDSPQNGLFLSRNIEIAFDKLQLSFVKSLCNEGDGQPREGFIMKIWDSECKDKSIWDGSTDKIGDFEGRALNLRKHKIIKSALSFQAYQAYANNNHHLDQSVAPPPDFSSQERPSSWTEMRNLLDSFLQDLKEQEVS